MHLCECGCGKETSIGKLSGKPNKFINGHNFRGVKKSKETCRLMSKAQKIRFSTKRQWNEGETKYSDNRIMEISKKNIGKKRTEFTLLIKSAAQKRVWLQEGYREHFSELRTGDKHPMWKGGKRLSIARGRAKRRRNLKWIPLNSRSDGCVGHHVNSEHVIYIPEEIHRKHPHRLNKPESMLEINKIAYNILNKKGLNHES